MSTMMYYPTMNPSEAAIHQAVLYWDKLSTIVPMDYERHVSRDVLRLQEVDLYRPTFISELTWLSASWDHPSPLPEHSVLAEVLDELARTLPVSRRRDDVLYPPKLGQVIVQMLLDRNLARRPDPQNPLPELLVPAPVSSVVLGTLARDIAAMVNNQHRFRSRVIPYTDDEAAHQAAHRLPANVAHRSGMPLVRTWPSWEVELGSFLPVPAPGTDIERLVEFRRRHEDERRQFVLAVDMLVQGLQRNPDQPQEVFRLVLAYLEEAERALAAAGKAHGITWLYRGLSVVIAFAAAGVGEELLPGAGWALGTIGGLAVNVATGEVRPADERYERVSYLSRVRRQFDRFSR